MSLNFPVPRDGAAAGAPADASAVPEPAPTPPSASAPAVPDPGAPARDLSGLAWLAPSLRSALEDAAAELGHYVDEVRQAPEALGARDTTSLRLAGQHLHQAAGAVHIVGLRGTDPYCQALRRLLEAIDAGTVAAGPEALAVFRAGVQALAEYVDDLMAGDDEAPLRLFQPYAGVLAHLGEERVHPADLWLDELQMLPGMLLPTQGPAAVMRARQQFESALLKALRLPAPCTDAALLREAWLPLCAALDEVRANEQEARRAADHPDRGVWHVLGLVFRALGLGLLPSDLLAKRFAGRANLLLRQYLQGHVRVPQALLNDAVFLLVCTGLARDGAGDDDGVAAPRAALRADIARTLAAFRLDPGHALANADFRQRYYGWLDPIDTRNLQQAAAGLEHAAAGEPAGWETALAALAEAAQPLG
ncbi:MAG: Hpt domain-containing protein, partial [Cupriavidus necator]